MTSRDSTDCRERLATLMAEVNAQLAALEGMLVQEYALLESSDVENLEKAATARQQCIGHPAHRGRPSRAVPRDRAQ